MSWVAVGLATVAVAGAGSAYQQRVAGKIAQGEAETAALAEEGAAVAREADRKARLNEALASQNAAAGAGGLVAFEGSPLSVMKEDTRREGVATERDKFSTNIAALTLRARGKIARKQANFSSNMSLINTAGKTMVAAGMSGGEGKGDSKGKGDGK